jgi:hypothetical protein
MLAEMVRLFGPNASALRSLLDADAHAWLSVVGEVAGLVVSSAEQAEERRIDWGDREPFKPFFDGDRVGLYFTAEVVAFLAAIGASIATHIDFELDDEHPNWWEHE